MSTVPYDYTIVEMGLNHPTRRGGFENHLFRQSSFFFSFLLTEAPDSKQEERLQELESCSGVGSTSDDTEVREVSSRPSTPGLSVVSGINLNSFHMHL